MTKPKTGDIWLVKFHPSTGQELAKYRPAVIISDLTTIDDRFALIAPFTSATTKRNAFEHKITNSALEKPSLLLAWYLRTIDKRRLNYRLGKLSAEDIKLVKKSIAKLLNNKQ